MKSARSIFMALLVGGVSLSASVAHAQQGEDLREAAQNPIADLISVPFQNNTNFDIGHTDNTQDVLNIQPVYPIHLNPDWNRITRPILPVISQPPFLQGAELHAAEQVFGPEIGDTESVLEILLPSSSSHPESPYKSVQGRAWFGALAQHFSSPPRPTMSLVLESGPPVLALLSSCPTNRHT